MCNSKRAEVCKGCVGARVQSKRFECKGCKGARGVRGMGCKRCEGCKDARV